MKLINRIKHKIKNFISITPEEKKHYRKSVRAKHANIYGQPKKKRMRNAPRISSSMIKKSKAHKPGPTFKRSNHGN